MTLKPDDEVVRVAYGELVDIEMYHQALQDAGIKSHVVGQELDAAFGSALLGSMELYVHQSDGERALAAIQRVEREKGQGPRSEPPPHGPAQSDHRPE